MPLDPVQSLNIYPNTDELNYLSNNNLYSTHILSRLNYKYKDAERGESNVGDLSGL